MEWKSTLSSATESLEGFDFEIWAHVTFFQIRISHFIDKISNLLTISAHVLVHVSLLDSCDVAIWIVVVGVHAGVSIA